MQVLFTCVPGHGHLNPMVPLARELVSRGCDVRFATGDELAARVEALGFRCHAAGPTLAAMQSNAIADPRVRAALDAEPWVAAAAIFGGRVGAVAEGLDDADLSPDLVVHDAMELAGPFIAARYGVPWVTHGLGPRWPSLVEDAIPSNTNAEVFRTLIEAVGSLDLDVLITTGWGVGRDELGPVPANVLVEEYVPQGQVLDQVSLVVCHGGSGTMLASLGAGLPVVALPQGADQFVNAPCWLRSGAVAVLQPSGLDVASIASTVASTLHSAEMRAAAELASQAMAAMPPPSESADAVLALAEP